MRTFVSILAGLGISFALGAIDMGWLHGVPVVIFSRPIAMLLSALTGIPLEQEASIVLFLAAIPITLLVIGIALGVTISVGLPGAFRASRRSA